MRTLKTLLLIGSALVIVLTVAGCGQAKAPVEKTQAHSVRTESVTYDDNDCMYCHDGSTGRKRPLGKTFDQQLWERGSDSTGDAPALTVVGTPKPGSAKVAVHYRNFKMSDSIGMPDVPGEGHVAWTLDGGPTTENAATTLDAEGLSGTHTIKVELHRNDHEPLDPPVETTVEFKVDDPKTAYPYDYMVPTSSHEADEKSRR